ncbi:hypothetical protein GCM10011571_05990 [Marinithermofilum abyssi]|uniref:Uncharacterized protein n=1 Tax=Marinithermofilum abyssi TaxID=1571185 RepID=A0A8J2VEF7_9BACL|nr:hypothetical protein [Marinithermofilum abyssi]GGE07529.1 hypothetical protein GCM10011571_05990 [Marinithermofilum abyssi]
MRYGRRPQTLAAMSPDRVEAMEFYFLHVLNAKSVTKAEIKLMGYLIRRYLHLGETGKKTMRITEKDWVKDAGLTKAEIDKALKKCADRGWISIDTSTRPAGLHLHFRTEAD